MPRMIDGTGNNRLILDVFLLAFFGQTARLEINEFPNPRECKKDRVPNC